MRDEPVIAYGCGCAATFTRFTRMCHEHEDAWMREREPEKFAAMCQEAERAYRAQAYKGKLSC